MMYAGQAGIGGCSLQSCNTYLIAEGWSNNLKFIGDCIEDVTIISDSAMSAMGWPMI